MQNKSFKMNFFQLFFGMKLTKITMAKKTRWGTLEGLGIGLRLFDFVIKIKLLWLWIFKIKSYHKWITKIMFNITLTIGELTLALKLSDVFSSIFLFWFHFLFFIFCHFTWEWGNSHFDYVLSITHNWVIVTLHISFRIK